MNKPLVSIIIPIYNAQDYLERCLASCCNQSFHSIEVLMINDGSTDRSEEICRQFTRDDNRFKLINQKNDGVSRARNTGIKNAQGTYLTFADSDDWLDKDAVKEYVERIENDHTDLAIAGFYRVINTIQIPMEDIGENLIMTRKYFAGCMADSPADFYYGVVWNKMYRTEIIKAHHLFFSPRFKWCEDFLFNLEYLQYTEKISTLKEHLYYYVKRIGSVCESQLTYTRTISLKYELLCYYRNLYKSINIYNDNKLKINGFLFAYAHDSGETEYRKLHAEQISAARSARRTAKQKAVGNKKQKALKTKKEIT